MKLTRRQREAVQSWARGDICVVAGPGSGKTTVLVERFRWLAANKGLQPSEILAITFTEKAANNMKEKLLEGCKDQAARRAFEQAQISTIHAFCARLLRERSLEAGLDPDFRVIDEWEASLELRRAIAEVLDEAYEAGAGATLEFLQAFAGAGALAQGAELSRVHEQIFRLYESIRAWGERAFSKPSDPEHDYQQLVAGLRRAAGLRSEPALLRQAESLAAQPRPFTLEHLKLVREIQSQVQELAARGAHKEIIRELKDELFPRCGASLVAQLCENSRHWLLGVLEAIDRRYREWKRAAASLDFSDLEEEAVKVLKQSREPAIAFKHILIDEYQDTNPLQAELVKLLRGAGSKQQVFFAVGDINQSIYGFRHADPEVFHKYRREVKKRRGHIVELVENWRSRPEILKLANVLFAEAEGIENRDLVSEIEFAPKKAPSVEVLIAREEDGPAARSLEASHVAARIAQLRDELRFEERSRSGQPPPSPSLLFAEWRDFAILLRSRSLIEVFAGALREAGIPYQLTAGQGFFEAEEVRDLIRFLQVIRNPRDEVSLAAVLCSPLAGISDETLLRLKMAASYGNLVDGLRRPPKVDPGDAERLRRFTQMLESCRAIRDDVSPDVLLARQLSQSGYEAYLFSQPGGAGRVANARKLVRLVRRLSEGGSRPFEEFMERLDQLCSSGLSEPEAPVLEEDVNAVHLMTLHAAKGLEFPVVFLPSLESGTSSDSNSLCFSPRQGIGVEWLDPATREKQKDPTLLAFHSEQKQRTIEEENRLLYVGATRAEQHLALSAACGSRLVVRNWAKYLRDRLGVDFKEIDNRPRVKQAGGCRFRLLVTNQPPAASKETPARKDEEKEWIRLDPARPGDQSDSAAAVTSVALYAECPRKYYLSRYLGFERSPSPRREHPEEESSMETEETDVSEFGRRVHQILAGALPPEEARPEEMELVQRFQESELGRRARKARAQLREQNLLFPIGFHLLRGQIDLWFDDENEQVLVDYKTDQVTARQARNRAANYALQIQLYAQAMEQRLGRRPGRGVLYFLRPGVAEEVDLSSSALEQARRAVDEFFAAQSTLQFPLNVAKHCFRCPHYRGLCPANPSQEAGETSKAESL